jgi:hypothetical protein
VASADPAALAVLVASAAQGGLAASEGLAVSEASADRVGLAV